MNNDLISLIAGQTGATGALMLALWALRQVYQDAIRREAENSKESLRREAENSKEGIRRETENNKRLEEVNERLFIVIEANVRVISEFSHLLKRLESSGYRTLIRQGNQGNDGENE